MPRVGCRIFSTARERLRREALRGRIFGTSSPSRSSPENEVDGYEADLPRSENDILTLFLKPLRGSAADDDDLNSPNGQWKHNSWRRKEGKKSRGRVKGIARVFEDGNADNATLTRSDSFKRKEEIEEVRRVRRARGSSTDSELSVGSSGAESVDSERSFPDLHLPPTDMLDDMPAASNSKTGVYREDQPLTPTNELLPLNLSQGTHVDWSQVEPLTLEDTSSLPAQFLTQEAQDALPPSTPASAPISGLPRRPELADEVDAGFTFLEAGDIRTTPSIIVASAPAALSLADACDEGAFADIPDEAMAPMPFADEKYQSRILAHGREAYSPIARRSSITSYFPKLPLPGSSAKADTQVKAEVRAPGQQKGSTFSEMTDELSEEHLAFWMQDQRASPSTTAAAARAGLPKSSSDPLHIAQTAIGDGSLLFAEAEGEKKLTVKRLDSVASRGSSGRSRPRSHSNDNFASLRMSSIISRGSSGSKLQADVRSLFAETGGEQEEEEIVIRMKGRREEDVVVMSRTEVEQVRTTRRLRRHTS